MSFLPGESAQSKASYDSPDVRGQKIFFDRFRRFERISGPLTRFGVGVSVGELVERVIRFDS